MSSGKVNLFSPNYQEKIDLFSAACIYAKFTRLPLCHIVWYIIELDTSIVKHKLFVRALRDYNTEVSRDILKDYFSLIDLTPEITENGMKILSRTVSKKHRPIHVPDSVMEAVGRTLPY